MNGNDMLVSFAGHMYTSGKINGQVMKASAASSLLDLFML